jgi:hypothetical protein
MRLTPKRQLTPGAFFVFFAKLCGHQPTATMVSMTETASTDFASPPTEQSSPPLPRWLIVISFLFLILGLLVGFLAGGTMMSLISQDEEPLTEPSAPVTTNDSNKPPSISKDVTNSPVASVYSLTNWIQQQCNSSVGTDFQELPLETLPLEVDPIYFSKETATCIDNSYLSLTHIPSGSTTIHDTFSQELAHGGPTDFGEYGLPLFEDTRTVISVHANYSHGGPTALNQVAIIIRGARTFPTIGGHPFTYTTSYVVIPEGDARVISLFRPFTEPLEGIDNPVDDSSDSNLVISDTEGANRALQSQFLELFAPESQDAVKALKKELSELKVRQLNP